MEYISNKYKKGKSKFKFNKVQVIILFFLLIITFVTGIWWEKYEFDRVVDNFFKDFVDTATSRLYSNFSSQEKMIIDINYNNYQKLLNSRELSINNYRATEALQEWVPARLTFKNKEYRIKIKLKGTHQDHWEHPNKWSFKIKVKNGQALLNVREFSIQHPKTRGYLYEWLFMQALKKEKLISHRVRFYEVVVNGNSLGIYNFEEQHSKELLENNERREAPIIGFDKTLWIEEANNAENLSVNSLYDSFWRAKISAVNLAKIKIGSEQELYLKNAINLLESFRNGSLSVSEVFDTEQMAKLMALRALFGSIDFDWRDIKFYYNPITSLLEPIGREVHSGRQETHTWWIDDSITSLSHSVDQKFFLELLYSDIEFYKKYLSELYRISDPNYFNELIKNNKEQFSKNKKILMKNYPSSDLFSKENIEFYRKQIRDTLDPIQGLNVYFLNYENNVLSLSVGNLQRLPIEISGLIFDDLSKVMSNDNIIIDGKKPDVPVEHTTIRLKCLSDQKCNQLSIKNQFLFYKIAGQDKVKKSTISFWNNLDENFIHQQTLKYKTNLKNKEYIEVKENKKEILIKQGNWNLSEKLIFPQGYKIIAGSGTVINLDDEAQIVSYSPIYFNGSKKEPIVIKSNYGGKIEKARESAVNTSSNLHLGYGILVINADSTSKINNVIFKRLSAPPLKSGQGLVGAINFYESDVEIANTIFLENIKGDDYLNIIRSNFSIKNSSFINIYSDAFDSDFSKGLIENVSFKKIKNDALDFSGSFVEGKQIYILEAGDKGVSAGEKSIIKLNDIVVENSNLAFASKDLSKLIINNGSVSHSKIVAAAYNKKFEYGPGKLELYDMILKNNDISYLVEKNSSIQVDGSEIPISNINFSKY